MIQSKIILGIESSCDDTAAAILHSENGQATILSSIVMGQDNLHAAFGGVVPEIAARAHVERLDLCIEKAVDEANITLSQIDVIAVTSGPGLIGGVISGVMCAKGLAAGLNKPLIGINHLAGHALTPRMTEEIEYPYLILLVSGGHCQFLIVQSATKFTRIGGTIDDAPGEAFDKTAKLLSLGYPGGPLVEEIAKTGDKHRFKFPKPLVDRPGCDMSFSGLKTALRRARDRIIAEKSGITQQDRADLCASFQFAISETLAIKTQRACAVFLEKTNSKTPTLAIAGGVAANSEIRAKLKLIADSEGFVFVASPLKYCTDNAAMIAWAGYEHIKSGQKIDPTTLVPRPRWPLDQNAKPMLGSGKKGVKA